MGEVHRLYAYQAEGVQALVENACLLLADDMGLGKTIQAIAALSTLQRRKELEAALIVVPAGLVPQWRAQIGSWAPDLRCSTIRGGPRDRAWQWRVPAQVFLVSYDTLRSDFTTNPHSPVSRQWDVVILDEAQRIKNRDIAVAHVCKHLNRTRAWALTGTPIENSLEDLASVVEFLQPNSPAQRQKSYRPGVELLARHQELQLRRRKSDVLPQLPPKTLIPVLLDLTREQRMSYDQAEREGVVELRSKGRLLRIQHVLELITRLKQICNFCPRTGESAKLQDLTDRMTSLTAQGDRALIFSQFADDSFGVGKIVANLTPFRPLAYTGGLSISQREDVVRAFRERPDHQALVLSLRAGGLGLNLQEASYVFHFDRWWNPALEHQAEDRTHRLGQEKPVFVYAYTAINTIEERIQDILARKQRLFDDLVDQTSISLTRLLSADELFGLFEIAPPPAAAGAP